MRQRPGPRNALGLAKFIFPNSDNIYMHDTPSTALFARSRRDFSHGCIRGADPAGLAAFVLADQSEWTRERIRGAMQGSDPSRVNLTRPLLVLIFYSTALVMLDGTVHFYPDIYGHDERLEAEPQIQLLTQETEYLREAVREMPGHDDLLGSRYPEALEKRTGL